MKAAPIVSIVRSPGLAPTCALPRSPPLYSRCHTSEILASLETHQLYRSNILSSPESLAISEALSGSSSSAGSWIWKYTVVLGEKAPKYVMSRTSASTRMAISLLQSCSSNWAIGVDTLIWPPSFPTSPKLLPTSSAANINHTQALHLIVASNQCLSYTARKEYRRKWSLVSRLCPLLWTIHRTLTISAGSYGNERTTSLV
mmetsp:Transcript_21317/g.82723  ORF Transcript_21317/g.82723 Transcript_21317/m.82723 type:complete len:201 (-) Transcript_21317:25-627(-)